MKRSVYLLSIWVGIILVATPVQAEIINLNYVSAATGVDEGPQDGVFDSLTDLNLGSVNNNGWTSFRTAFEFSLAALPAGSTITSAKLTVGINNFAGTRQIEVHGYAGNGTVDLGDLSGNNLLRSASVSGEGTQILAFDVTAFLAEIVAGGGTFAGFNVREEPANTENYEVMGLILPALPILSVELSTERIVDIDIRPGSVPNSINPRNMGSIPVAILSDSGLDAPAEVDPNSLTFGRTGDEMSLAFCNRNPEDVNGDGMLDLVCHFETRATGFLWGDTQGVLKGKTLSGVPIKGTDSVRLVQ